MNERRSALPVVKILLYAFFIVAVIIPLFTMFVTIGETDVGALITSPRFQLALSNSLKAALAATAISISLGMVLAWAVVRSKMPGKQIFTLLFTLPMLIPSISHGMGLIILLGANGVLTNLLGLQSSVYGFSGLVTGSVMYAFPVAFLMLSDVLKYEDSTPYEAASVLGITRYHQFTAITLPYLRRPLISAVFAVFTMVITDYGVPLMVGGQYTTLPVMMYQDVIGLLDFGKGSVIGVVLLFPAFIAFILDIINQERGNPYFTPKPFELRKSRNRDAAALSVSLLVALFVLLPIISFGLLTFVEKYPRQMQFSMTHILRTMQMQAGRYLGNSLLISLLTGLIGTFVCFTAAYVTSRSGSRGVWFLHLLSITSMAVPGIVLGLSYVLFFNGSFIYGTLAILLLVNLMHFFSSPYLMMYNTMNKLNRNYESVGATLGVSRIRIIINVLLPLSRGTAVEAFSYFFVNAMVTISAVSFLATASTRPVSLMITSFEATMMLESAAFVSLLILSVNLLLKLGITILKKKWTDAV